MTPLPSRYRAPAVAAFFLALAILATWPVATDPAHLSVDDPTGNDYRFNIYVIFWGAHALVTNPLALHHTNMFHPERYTFAYSDIELAHSILLLPVIIAFENPILTYNVLLIASIVIGGTGFFLLAHALTGGGAAALLGAVFWVFNPVHFTRYQQIPLFGDHWLPWFAWALWHWLEGSGATEPVADALTAEAPRGVAFARGSRPLLPAPKPSPLCWALVAAAFYCLHALTGSHNAVFGAVVGCVLIIYVATRRRLWAKPSFVRGLAAMIVLAVVVLAPVFWPYLVLEEQLAAKRGETLDLAGGSARPFELLSASSRFYRWLDDAVGWPSLVNRRGRELATNLFPGVVTLALALGALASTQRRRPRLRVWIYLAGLCFLLALGVYGGFYPLLGHVPVLRLIRVPTRFMLPSVFALAVVATFGVLALAERIRRPQARAFALGVVALLFALEAAYAPLPTYPYETELDAVVRFLAAEPGDFAVVEFPLDPAGYAVNMRQAFRSIHHWKRLLVGYSGYQSDENAARLARLDATFPSDAALDELVTLGVRYVIVREARMGPATPRAIRQQPRLVPVRSFDDTWVYLLASASGQSRPTSGRSEPSPRR